MISNNLQVNGKLDNFLFDKVHIFWEGHKNWQNLRCQFDSM